MPAAASHLALMPVPAPAPMIGSPQATLSRSRCKMSWRESVFIDFLMYNLGLAAGFPKQAGRTMGYHGLHSRMSVLYTLAILSVTFVAKAQTLSIEDAT